MSEARSVGLIGVGTMGRGLARNIVKGGFDLNVFDAHTSAVEQAKGLGAHACNSIGEVAAQSDIVLTCLPSVGSIREVYLGAGGLIERARKGALLVDCSTSDPDLTREIGERAIAAGCTLVDAPMLRNAEAAWNAKLHLLVGGTTEDVARARPVLEVVCERIVETGPLGSAHVVKLLNNAVTIVNAVVVSETFTLARKFGVDLDTLYGVMDASYASSKALHGAAPRLIKDDHSPAFALDVALKDISLYTKLGQSESALTPLGNATRDLMTLASALGFGADHHTRVATLLAAAARITPDDAIGLSTHTDRHANAAQ